MMMLYVFQLLEDDAGLETEVLVDILPGVDLEYSQALARAYRGETQVAEMATFDDDPVQLDRGGRVVIQGVLHEPAVEDVPPGFSTYGDWIVEPC